MKRFLELYDRCVGALQASGSTLSAVAARATLGWLFIDSGWQKWHNLDQIVSFFQSLGIPAPGIQAPMVATVEFVGGICIVLGLLTRLASVPLMGTMVVAILTAKRDDLHGFSDLIGFTEFLYLLLLAYLVVYGAGRLSADHLLARGRDEAARRLS